MVIFERGWIGGRFCCLLPFLPSHLLILLLICPFDLDSLLFTFFLQHKYSTIIWLTLSETSQGPQTALNFWRYFTLLESGLWFLNVFGKKKLWTIIQILFLVIIYPPFIVPFLILFQFQHQNWPFSHQTTSRIINKPDPRDPHYPMHKLKGLAIAGETRSRAMNMKMEIDWWWT